MNVPIPVVLVTGYLGAGKTTLLKRLLQLPEITGAGPALLVNEFGHMGVDGQWFQGDGWPLFEINRGSLFCVCTKTDLIAALTSILQLQPGMVLVEATGVAETRDFESLLDQPGLAGRFVVRANICLVDAMNFTKVAPFLKAARGQVATADGLVVNKTELVSETVLASLVRLLSEMNPRARQVQVSHAAVDYAFLESLSHQRTEEALAIAQPESIYSRSFRSTAPVDRESFCQAVEQVGDRLLRLKGHLRFTGRSDVEFVEVICGELSFGPATIHDPQLGFAAIAFGLPDAHLQQVFQPLM